MEGEVLPSPLSVFRTLDSYEGLTQKDDLIDQRSRISSLEYQSLTNMGEVNSKKEMTKEEGDTKIIAAQQIVASSTGDHLWGPVT